MGGRDSNADSCSAWCGSKRWSIPIDLYGKHTEGERLPGPKYKRFEVLMGPTASRQSSTQIINGNVTSNQLSYLYLYIDGR